MRRRLLCLVTLLSGALLASPAMAQQASPPAGAPIQIARTTDDLREKILLDRIDELERRIADLETRESEPAATATIATTPAAPASAPEPAPQDNSGSSTWSIGPVDFSGAIDGYYSFNTNHPAAPLGFGGNQFYNFNTNANQFDLNLAKVTLSHDADPVGFKFELGYGRTMSTISNAFDLDLIQGVGGGFSKFVEQAYVTWKPGMARGLQLDLGKFNTSAGAEVIESYSNWNYSRSLLFALAIPYYHFGLRSAIPVGKHFTVGAQLVNGWNNVVDNNSGKSFGITSAATFGKVQWFANYYAGPENLFTNTGWRHLIDTTVLVTANSKLAAYINYDYGQNRNAVGSTATSLSRWQGFAGAIHWSPTSKWSFTPRGEWFRDYQGFSTGTVQTLDEITFTAEYKLMEGLLWRAEYRRDWSDVPVFTRGSTPFAINNQNTATVAFVGFFGPKR